MRKKLESRKGASKDSEKLAIESRSLADFKIPEIPLKKLQDIFKNNDLLRSRSESDLLSTKKLSIKDPMKNINIQNEIIEARFEKNHSERMTKSLRSIRTLEQLSSAKSSIVNHSSQSVFDESITEQIEIDKLGSASMSSVSDGTRSEKNIPCGTQQYINEIQNKQSISDVKKSSISEDVKTEINTPKSESDIYTQSEAKFSKYDTTIQSDLKEYKSDFDTFSEQSRIKTISSQSKINKSQHSEHLEHILSEKPNNIQHSNAEINTESVNESLDFSKKLDFLRLNNQNLNEDISSLENELKILSEMMSRFNKKSIEEKKYELQNEEKSTSKDISEIHSVSDKINEVYDVEIIKEDKIKNVELHSKESNSEIPQYLTNNTRLLSPTNFSDSNSIVEEVDNVISVIMPQSKMSTSKSSSQEIDYKARSKKILNEIEKSIISEHIKVPKDERSEISIENKNLSLYKRNEEISNDTSANIKSLSEIYSKSIQDKNRCINILEFETIYPEKNIEENLTDLNNVESYQSLKSKKSSLLSSENFEDNEKDKSLNQNTDINLSSIINDISSTEIHLENKNNSALKDVQDVSKQATVTEYVNELLKRQVSPQLSNSMKTIETSKESIDYVKDIRNDNMSYQNINDIHLVSKTKNLELLLKESKELTNNNKNETVFTQTEEMIESQEVSQKSIKRSKQDISDLNMSKKEIIENNNQSEVFLNKTFNKNDWTISDSFDVISAWEKSQSQTSKSFNDLSTLNSKNISQSVNYKNEIINDIENDIENDVEDIEDVSSFIPKSESTNIEIHEIKFDETLDHDFEKFDNKSKDELHVISKNNDEEQNENSIETNDFQKIIYDSVTKILDKVEKSIENNIIKEKTENHTDMDNVKNKNEIQIEEREKSISSNVILSSNLEENLEKNKMKFSDINEEISFLNFNNDKNIDEEITINENTEIINTNVEIKNDENTYCTESKSREIIITELEPESIENESLSELEIDAKIELAEEELIETDKNKEEIVSQEQKFLETIIEQDSSDGEQLDNLVEVTESVLDVIEKGIKCSTDSIIELKSISSDKTNDYDVEIQDNKIQSEENSAIVNDIKTMREHVEVDTSNVSSLNVMMNKTFDIVKDPEYEDISEESLEVSEIFDKSELQKSTIIQKSSIPEKYEAIQKSEKVLKILDEITQKPLLNSENDINKFEDNECISENNKELQISDKISIKNNQSLSEIIENQKSEKIILEKENQLIENVTNMNETKKKKQEQDVLSESSEDRDTPKGVSEIDMDSPRDLNDSRLDIDVLNDDLLSNPNIENQNIDSKNTFHATPIVATSEKDIEVMIDKLKGMIFTNLLITNFIY